MSAALAQDVERILARLEGASHAVRILDWLSAGPKSFDELVALRAAAFRDFSESDRAVYSASTVVHDLKALESLLDFEAGRYALPSDIHEAVAAMRAIGEAWKAAQR